MILEIEMIELRKDKDVIKSDYSDINKKYHKIIDTAIKAVLGRKGLKSKIVKAMLGSSSKVIVQNLELLNGSDIVTSTSFSDIPNGMKVALNINDKVLKYADSLKKMIYSFGLYHTIKSKGFDADKLDSSKFVKNLGKTGRNYAHKSSYKIVKGGVNE